MVAQIIMTLHMYMYVHNVTTQIIMTVYIHMHAMEAKLKYDMVEDIMVEGMVAWYKALQIHRIPLVMFKLLDIKFQMT